MKLENVLAVVCRKAFRRSPPFDAISHLGIPSTCERPAREWNDDNAAMEYARILYLLEVARIRKWARSPSYSRLLAKLREAIRVGLPAPDRNPLTVFPNVREFSKIARTQERHLLGEHWSCHSGGIWSRTFEHYQISYQCEIEKHDSHPEIMSIVVCGEEWQYKTHPGTFFSIDTMEYLWFRDLREFADRYFDFLKVVELLSVEIDQNR